MIEKDEMFADTVGKLTCLACRRCKYVCKTNKYTGKALTQDEAYNKGWCEKFWNKPEDVYFGNKPCSECQEV